MNSSALARTPFFQLSMQSQTARHGGGRPPAGHGGNGGGGGGGSYGSVVGEFDHEVVMSGGKPHARLEINVNGKQVEADINTHSIENPDGSPGGSDVLYAIHDEVVPSMPADGITKGGGYNYYKGDWKASEFKDATSDQMHDIIMQQVKNCQKVEINGMWYSASGIHDVHDNDNSGNAAQDASTDGLLRTFRQEADGVHMVTIAIKFQNQVQPN